VVEPRWDCWGWWHYWWCCWQMCKVKAWYVLLFDW